MHKHSGPNSSQTDYAQNKQSTSCAGGRDRLIKTDILIIGSGISGLSLALKAAQHFNVIIITKNDAMESNTRYAQGGIASVMAQIDNFESHIRDTMEAGAEINDLKSVEKVVRSGPRLINELLKIGVRFARTRQNIFDLGMEGGHSQRRVLHASDVTGLEVEKKLLLKAKKNPKISILEYHAAIDLIMKRHLKRRQGADRCYGAYALDKKTGRVVTIKAGATVLATGGAGKTYLYTSNPDIASGDGIAMACRAGCRIANLEFVQFHPTCLYDPRAKSFLLSEALRGEGGKLRLVNGKRFMQHYHYRNELAPRDIVARAIDYELKKSGERYVTLDMTHHSRAFLKKRFPTIYKTCLDFGYDLAARPVPVVPAAHYFCGGVKIDLSGRTNINNLYAVGEVTCSGLHGANRLASNSLLESLAFADFVYRDLIKKQQHIKASNNQNVNPWDTGRATDSDELVGITQNWDEIRRMMWNYVGIVRSNKRLLRARARIKIFSDEIREFYWNFTLTPNLLELRNVCQVADLTIRCALKRKESVGLHYNIDYPKPDLNSMKYNIIR
ncbi:MAG: L-aspartate oxidase [Deltaproteobacteria bacterium]|nr:L-aspartate oxidase [Deltaproteobacteria bacterium]